MSPRRFLLLAPLSSPPSVSSSNLRPRSPGPGSKATTSVRAAASRIGRVGVRAGLEFPNEKSTFYARVSGAWEMMGEDEYHAVADAGRVESFRTELDGGWSEYAVGANFKLAPNAFVWADLEKIAGGDIRENYRYTISARRVW